MARAWVSVGSNVEPERHVRAALDDLRGLFGKLVVSPLYETEAVGFEGAAFLNLVVGFDTELPAARVHGLLRAVEARHGRQRGGERFAPRTLDLDLLTYGDAVTGEGGRALPRDEIERYAFVLAPLADVAGDQLHPRLGESFGDLWARFPARSEQPLRRLDDPAWLERGDMPR